MPRFSLRLSPVPCLLPILLSLLHASVCLAEPGGGLDPLPGIILPTADSEGSSLPPSRPPRSIPAAVQPRAPNPAAATIRDAEQQPLPSAPRLEEPTQPQRSLRTDDGFYTISTDRGIMRIKPPAQIPITPPPAPQDDFVQRQGHQLFLKGKPFYFVGMNAYWFIDQASWGREHGRKQVVEACRAAQRLGMKVIRTWAFNTRMPYGPGLYDEEQFEALDFIIYAAHMHDLRLILALGNFWDAYKAPEEFLFWAYPKGGYDVLDFYRGSRVKELYKAHITAILSRVNVFTGIKHADDPTIVGWDVLNEPRCPSCLTAEQQAVAVGWMHEMASHTKQLAPNQLAALGTEGFFIEELDTQLHLLNPGPGAQCEGEDWTRIKSLSSVDFATLHLYERHMEYQPVPAVGRKYAGDPDWFHCDFSCFINWAVRYIQAHVEVSEKGFAKPLILEEFGLSWWKAEVRDRRVMLAVIYRLLEESARNGGSFAGAMLWNGAHNDSSDQDGYNVKIDAWPTALAEDPPLLNRLPPIVPFMEEYARQGANRQDAMVQMAGDGKRRRSLKYQQDKLDGFRRGWQRGACAHDSSKVWRPPLEFINGTSISKRTTNRVGTTWQAVADMQAMRGFAWKTSEVDLIAWAAGKVNNK